MRFVLFGHPVSHSMSPVIHAAAYRALGFEHRYELVDVADAAELAQGVERVRTGELAGANVTVPWKREALALADVRAASARKVGAANVLSRGTSGEVVAHNTDVPALAEEIRRYVAQPESVLVIGSGGAALAAVAAAALLGASEVTVSARRWQAGVAREAWSRAEEFRALGARLLAFPDASNTATDSFAAAARSASVIVQATSAGMHGAEAGESVAEIVPWAELSSSVLAYDVVYNPLETPFLRAARAHGLRAEHGLGMLVTQAALAIELWLGAKPPREPLYAAAAAELSARRSR